MNMIDPQELQKKNQRLALKIFLFVFFMVGVAFASVPLYDLFCRVTGFGGTTQVAQSLPDTVLDRSMRIRFNAATGRNLPWTFEPEQNEITVRIGDRGLTAFYARNDAAEPVTGTAIYNVTPLKVGKYFHKIQCFCFDRQTLEPGRDMNMPVMFFVDPSIADDPNMDDVTTITLSYTFYESDTSDLDSAMEAFYNEGIAAIKTQ